VPDGPLWRVAAGIGLRPLEHRLVVDDTSWLVQTLTSPAARGRLLLTDLGRTRTLLYGAPLAAWSDVVAVLLPAERAILAAARRDQPFTPRDLVALERLAGEAAPLIGEALAVRHLARSLRPFLDDPD
jgi:hypothetical protein